MKKNNIKKCFCSGLAICLMLSMMAMLPACSQKADSQVDSTESANVFSSPATTETESPAESLAPTTTAPAETTKPAAQAKESFIDLSGKWENETGFYDIVIYQQSGNTISFTIDSMQNTESMMGSYATAKIENVVLSNGKGSFRYCDSFSNTGTGVISVSSGHISISFQNEQHPGNWGVDVLQQELHKTKNLSELTNYNIADY